MFPSLQNTQRNQAIQPDQASRMRVKKVFRLLQLLTAVLFALFFAGIAAPSFIRSELARNFALASGSLHSLTIAHITFTYTFWNLASALLGALFGGTKKVTIYVWVANSKFRPESDVFFSCTICGCAT